MKIYDTLIRISVNPVDHSRAFNGQAYAKCHELNAIASKKVNTELSTEHYFVLSNAISPAYIIRRSFVDELLPMDGTYSGVTVSYEPTKYRDFILFSGTNCIENKIDSLSAHAQRYVFNKKTESVVKKVRAFSSSGFRDINLYRTEFKEVDIVKYENELLNGIGGRKSYGCGLIIPTAVHSHLCNFVSK